MRLEETVKNLFVFIDMEQFLNTHLENFKLLKLTYVLRVVALVVYHI